MRDDFPVTWWAKVLADPDAWLKDPALHFKNSKNVTVARIPSPAPTFPNLVLRRVNYGRVKQKLRDFFRRSRARRMLLRALELEAAGLRVSAALAAADVRRFHWPLRGYVLMLEVPQARTLKGIVKDHRGVPRALENNLADLLARLHGAGFRHRDLKASNILFSQDDEPWFIDFDGVSPHGRGNSSAIKDLGRFGRGIREAGGRISLYAAGRFFVRYCRARQTQDWRQWLRAVAKDLEKA